MKKIGEFRTFEQWVTYASGRTYPAGVVFTDAKDRLCENGKDMMRARDDGAFPVSYFDPESETS